MSLKITYDEIIDCLVIKATDFIKCDDLLSLRELILNYPKFKPIIGVIKKLNPSKPRVS